MFPCTHFDPLARVDNLDVIFETRLNRQLQLCDQYNTLHMARVDRIDVWGPFVIVSVHGNMAKILYSSFVLKYLPTDI